MKKPPSGGFFASAAAGPDALAAGQRAQPSTSGIRIERSRNRPCQCTRGTGFAGPAGRSSPSRSRESARTRHQRSNGRGAGHASAPAELALPSRWVRLPPSRRRERARARHQRSNGRGAGHASAPAELALPGRWVRPPPSRRRKRGGSREAAWGVLYFKPPGAARWPPWSAAALPAGDGPAARTARCAASARPARRPCRCW